MARIAEDGGRSAMEAAHDDAAALRRKLDARDKTIAVLMSRLEERDARPSAAFAVLQQNLSLEQIVNSKTRELDDERRELDKALRELKATQARLLQAQKLESIGQLAAGIAHEINTPIQYVSDNVSFLKLSFDLLMGVIDAAIAVVEECRTTARAPQLVAAVDAATRRARIDYMRKQVPQALEQSIEGLQRVVLIVSAMKQFSHPSQGEKAPVNLAELIDTTVTVSRNEWKYVAEIRVRCDEGLTSVPCQRNEISQVLLNLIVNAAHAVDDAIAGSGGKGTITISAGLTDDWAEIRVADTGTGIPETIRDRVFDPFFTTKGVGKGTGQGLAIAYSTVVEKHGGQIFFESEPGTGTTFVVRLPLVQAVRAEDEACA